ncbi:LysR family transcriptional regulator [Paenibacillus kobensis]|uniref:LysR family transcriptional regulator n=1 Tax=Paenibacillus kobensis TaxID=59841 RepID=UPI000FDBA571|nr:LysR family transcriptional regulator [Paenibacillus kobensis]
MDLRTLKTFQMIVKYGSFVRAAQELNYVQSTVTMQMQRLEAKLGVPLIERGKDMALTGAGRLFYDQSLQIVKQMEHLQASLSDLKSGEAGHVRIGVTEPTASYRLPRILSAFMSAHPKIKVSVDIAGTAVLSEQLLRGDLEFALCTAPEIRSDFYFEPLFQEEFVAIMPSGHPLAQNDMIAPEDLQGHRLLVTSETCPYRKKLEMVMLDKGIAVQDAMEIGSMTALQFYVENGFGVALIPKIMAESATEGTAIRKISGSLIHMTTGILCKQSAYPFPSASHKLYEFLAQELVR